MDSRALLVGVPPLGVGTLGDLVPGSAPEHGLASFFLLGVMHIATGYDHLAFLAALFLGAESFGAVVRAVTGFTLGHSLTPGVAGFIMRAT